MQYERYVLPLTAVAAVSAAGVAGYLAWRRRAARSEAEQGSEVGMFVYGYPLDVEEDEVTFTAEDLMIDEETFPGFRQD